MQRHTAAAHEVTVIGNLQDAENVRVAHSRDITKAVRQANWMEAVLINLQNEVGDCLRASSLCRSTIRSAVDSCVGTFLYTFYEPFRTSAMSLCGKNYRNFDIVVAAVHEQLFRLHGIVDAVRVQAQLYFPAHLLESDSGAVGWHGPSSFAPQNPGILVNGLPFLLFFLSFFLERKELSFIALIFTKL